MQAFAGNATTDEEDNLEKQKACKILVSGFGIASYLCLSTYGDSPKATFEFNVPIRLQDKSDTEHVLIFNSLQAYKDILLHFVRPWVIPLLQWPTLGGKKDPKLF